MTNGTITMLLLRHYEESYSQEAIVFCWSDNIKDVQNSVLLIRGFLFGAIPIIRDTLWQWFSTLKAWRPTKDKYEHFGGPPLSFSKFFCLFYAFYGAKIVFS